MMDILRRPHRGGERDGGDLWVRCPRCKQLLYRAELEQSLGVCTKCKHHFRMTARQRINATADLGTFEEIDASMPAVDPLQFSMGSRTYREKLDQSVEATGLQEGFVFGTAEVEELPVVVGAIEIEFIGGSMGAVVGEKVARAIEAASREGRPLVLFSSSGGARMQEGAVALMQMAKCIAQLKDLNDQGLPYVSVMTDPCYGGVTASFAMLGDINIGEPGAFIGFAGPRVIEQTTRERLPPGAATAEFLLQHGMLDLVVARGDMRAVLGRLLRIYASATSGNRSRELEAANERRREVTVGT
ncbi:MAG TPA: acetyl-CoA carboxylase, carboxyltransferase subunit beta [Chloroflexota bacterium]|nr:acetyl-CoA carboxylase, carboxyltransferase subunit beta [Chloroflexota bacterium]